MTLENLIKAKGYSQTELAKMCNVTKGHISQIVHNKSNPSIKLLLKISEVLEVSPNDLLNRTKL